MNTLKQNKAIIRSFMRSAYTDAKLVELLDHARSGKLAFLSCCCFIGIPSSDHELQDENLGFYSVVNPSISPQHYAAAQDAPGALNAELAYKDLGPHNDPKRRRILIPLVLAEIRRRAKVSQPVEKREEVVA